MVDCVTDQLKESDQNSTVLSEHLSVGNDKLTSILGHLNTIKTYCDTLMLLQPKAPQGLLAKDPGQPVKQASLLQFGSVGE